MGDAYVETVSVRNSLALVSTPHLFFVWFVYVLIICCILGLLVFCFVLFGFESGEKELYYKCAKRNMGKREREREIISRERERDRQIMSLTSSATTPPKNNGAGKVVRVVFFLRCCCDEFGSIDGRGPGLPSVGCRAVAPFESS